MSDKLQQAIEGYQQLSKEAPVVLRYLEAIEQGHYQESILKVRN